MSTSDRSHNEAVAIIGLACKFPSEASTAEGFWQFLLDGRSAHSPWPEHRFGAGHYHPDNERVGTHSVKGAHLLAEDPSFFDAPFFGITRGEAISLDPQQRLVLENVYLALENAGIPVVKANGSNTSVFVSGFNHDYLSIINADPESPLRYRATGLTNSVLSNRVSWFFDFKGPSMTIDTACSSSLVTLHQACQSLRSGESDMAVSSGVTVLAYPNDVASMSYQGFLSQQGRCFSFDHRAEGYARGEGVGTVIVKRLSDAIRDGNPIRAIIRGTGVNQDGRTPGLTLPDSGAQERLIKRVYASAGLGVDDTAMVEAHGTGTAAGDPIEANGIARAFAARRKDLPPLFIGACKSGLGHLEGAAGAASVIKSVLVLESGIIPPNVNFEKVNPRIPAAKWRLQFPLEPTPWPVQGLRRISVNSFGVGGTNAHVILDDAYHYLQESGLQATHYTQPSAIYQIPESQINGDRNDSINGLANNHINGTSEGVPNALTNGHVDHAVNGVLSSSSIVGQPTAQGINGFVTSDGDDGATNGSDSGKIESPPTLITFSSFDEEGTDRNAHAQSRFLTSNSNLHSHDEKTKCLTNIAWTMSQRTQLPWRSYVLVRSLTELEERLAMPLPKPLRARTSLNIAFVFTGQGAQWYAMGRELLCYATFRESLEACSAYLTSLGAPFDLMDELAQSKETSRIDQPLYAQPACTALQVALVDLLRSWNVHPRSVVGHSSGEIAAAYCAGKLDREGAWRTSYFRGLVTGKATESKGAMVAVGLGEDALAPYLERIHAEHSGELVTACINSPQSSTVSGDVAKVEALRQALEADGLFAVKLRVQNAYHSAHMREFAEEYVRLVEPLNLSKALPSAAGVTMFSSVSGETIESDHLGGDYWVKNLLQPVRFSDALTALCFSRSKNENQASLRTDAAGANVFADVIIEIGPHGALQGAIRDILAAHAEGAAVTSFPTLNRSAPGAEILLTAIGHLFSRGYPVDISAINATTSLHTPRLLPNLPGYQFNHSQNYWYESRLSRNYRLRKEPRHDLFGAPVPDWDATAPRWRNVLRLSEQPWLRDHIVTDNVILPGVGYVIAAVEAARQIADPTAQLSGFRLRDVNMKRALIVPDTKEGVEVVLNFRPVDESSVGTSARWRRFQVMSYSQVATDWIEHCTGYLAVEYDTASNPVDDGREAECQRQDWQDAWDRAEAQCRCPWDFSKAYERLVGIGLNFGPLFQNVSNVKGTFDHSGQTMGDVTVPDVASVMPKGCVSEHLMHPAALDAHMHMALAAIMDATGKSNLEVAMVPRMIKEIWISAKMDPTPGHVYRVHSTTRKIAFEKFSTDLIVWDRDTQEARITWSGIEASPLDSASEISQASKKMCYEIEWAPYIEMYLATGDPATFHEMPKSDAEAERLALEADNRAQLASILLVLDALEVIRGEALATSKDHLIRFYDWMKYVHGKIHESKGAVGGVTLAEVERLKYDRASKAELYRRVANDNAFGELAVRMGKNILPVLRGEEDPLQLMFGGDDILDRVYRRTATLNHLPAQQKAFLQVLAKNKTDLRVLEVGAGVGSSTRNIMDALAPVGKDGISVTSSVSHYMYTDISASFFEEARENFQAYSGIMEYAVLDAELDVSVQEFEIGSYDLVVAQNVIHATENLVSTLSNLRKLLVPGGRLLLQEGIRQDQFWTSISFGQLPGWWMRQGEEPGREWMPWVSSEQWNNVLVQSGYTGAQFELPDSYDPELHTQSLFVAHNTLTDDKDPGFPWKNVVLVANKEPGDTFTSLVQEIKHSLAHELAVQNIETVSIQELPQLEYKDKLCIVLGELEKPLVADLSQSEFEGIRQMLTLCAGMLWAMGDARTVPQFGTATGLIRTTRWERDLEDANLVTLNIADPRPSTADIARSITKLCQVQFGGSLPNSDSQGEFMLENGRMLTSRLREATEADDFLQSTLGRPQPTPTPAKDAGRPIKLITTVPGLLEKLQWVTDEIYDTGLSETEVEIEIRAVGLNFRDLMIAMGEHTAYSMGSEAAGVISRVGSKVTDFAPGDRVVYICGLDHVGCMHTFGRLDQSTVAKIPDAMSFETAAGLPVVYATVIYSLREAGRLMEGESILIHAAAGGVGQAAIRYAQHVGAEIFATVSTPEKRDLLISTFGISGDHIFSSRDLTFVSGVLRVTKGRGVDVVLNSLSGEALRRSWDLIAPFGRFVEIGKKDATMNGKVDLRPYLRNVTMTSVDLVSMMKNKPFLIKMLTEETIRLWELGVAQPATPTTIMPMSQVVDALRILQAGTGMGKIILVPQDDDLLPIVPPSPPPYRFRPDVTYLLSGGLGGIGRSSAMMMASRGARNLAFLSSTGRITPAVETMTNALEAKGCHVRIFTCDVSDKERLREVLGQLERDGLPPIKGCMQGAMKLNDCMLENMSYDDFLLALRPKVQGSWNLHELLPRDLDFFVMLSSATGVLGNRSQANYAAGNTFQDALAYHRRQNGLQATTIDVGAVVDVGYVAEHKDHLAMTKYLGSVMEVLREEELQVLIEYAINPALQPPTQLVTGLTTMENHMSRGIPMLSYMKFPLFTQLRSRSTRQGGKSDGMEGPDVDILLRGARTLDEATEIVQGAFIEKLSSLLSVTIEDIDPDRTVSANGVDSLVALELRTFIGKRIKADIPVLEIMGSLSIAQLCRKMASTSKAVDVGQDESDEKAE